MEDLPRGSAFRVVMARKHAAELPVGLQARGQQSAPLQKPQQRRGNMQPGQLHRVRSPVITVNDTSQPQQSQQSLLPIPSPIAVEALFNWRLHKRGTEQPQLQQPIQQPQQQPQQQQQQQQKQTASQKVDKGVQTDASRSPQRGRAALQAVVNRQQQQQQQQDQQQRGADLQQGRPAASGRTRRAHSADSVITCGRSVQSAAVYQEQEGIEGVGQQEVAVEVEAQAHEQAAKQRYERSQAQQQQQQRQRQQHSQRLLRPQSQSQLLAHRSSRPARQRLHRAGSTSARSTRSTAATAGTADSIPEVPEEYDDEDDDEDDAQRVRQRVLGTAPAEAAEAEEGWPLLQHSDAGDSAQSYAPLNDVTDDALTTGAIAAASAPASDTSEESIGSHSAAPAEGEAAACDDAAVDDELLAAAARTQEASVDDMDAAATVSSKGDGYSSDGGSAGRGDERGRPVLGSPTALLPSAAAPAKRQRSADTVAPSQVAPSQVPPSPARSIPAADVFERCDADVQLAADLQPSEQNVSSSSGSSESQPPSAGDTTGEVRSFPDVDTPLPQRLAEAEADAQAGAAASGGGTQV